MSALSGYFPGRSASRVAAMVMAVTILTIVSRGRGQGHFVQTDAVDFKKILLPPPADNSEQNKKEIEQMLALQAKRTPEQIAKQMLADPEFQKELAAAKEECQAAAKKEKAGAK